MELGYLGPQGSHSHEAAKVYAPTATLIPMMSFYEIIQAVEEGEIDGGILPIENSTEGAVTFVMDGLLKTEEAKIVGELILPVYHNLVSLNDSIEEIDCIYSHPQAIEQCREYFRRYIPKALLISCESTSLACAKAKRKGKNFAAIANVEAALIYNLNVLQYNIQDNFLNQTRFIVISREPFLECLCCKTSIAFTFPDDKPGALHRVLKEFADRDINMTRIESRPAKTVIGKYIFYIDFIGTPKDNIVDEALCKIRDMTVFLKILGTYSAQ
ncbi:MAG TPA: prephenate dehydratase [Clostridia bacterium]|nr:prephenate dehydratase [Clostridia bacterium]